MASFIIKNVSKSYAVGKRSFMVLKKISFSLPDSGLFAIKGPSGSGKSTLLNLLAGLLPPDSGVIFFKKKNLASMDEPQRLVYRREKTAMLFQHYNLIDGATGLENVILPLLIQGVRREKAERKARALFSSFGMEPLMEKNVDVCSGGEKQRIALLRSLITDPEVLFSDEPTGALNEENARFVMETLKKEAKSKLVIMVSHNEDLISGYADGVIALENGGVKVIKEPDVVSPCPITKKEKEKHGERWPFFFTKRNIKRNALVNVVGFLSLLIGFSSLLLTIGFFYGSEETLIKEPTRSVGYRTFFLSEKSFIDVEGSPLQLVRSKRPEYLNVVDLLKEFVNVSVCPDVSYFFPESHAYLLNGEAMPPTSFETYWNFNESLLLRGDAPLEDDGGCLVNTEFLDEHPGLTLGDEISFANNYVISHLGEKDEGTTRYSFFIKGIVKEFSFLNSPKVYVPYIYIRNILERISLASISALLEESITAYNASSFLPDNHAVSGYRYLLFANNDFTSEKLFSLKENLDEAGSPLSLSSSAYDIKAAFQDLTKAFSLSLSVFVLIAFLAVFLIITMISYSSFMKRKKETAILLVLGANEKKTGEIYLLEEMVLVFLSALASLLLSSLLEKGANLFLENSFGISGLVKIPISSYFGIPFLVPIALIGFSLLLSFLSSFLPMRAIGRMPLSEILRDE